MMQFKLISIQSFSLITLTLSLSLSYSSTLTYTSYILYFLLLWVPCFLFVLQRQTTLPKPVKDRQIKGRRGYWAKMEALGPERLTRAGGESHPPALCQGGFACSFYYASIFLSIFFRASQIFRLRLFLQIVIHSKLSSSLQQLREGVGGRAEGEGSQER